MPATIPLTVPLPSTVAIDGELVLQLPLIVVLLKVVVLPAHTCVLPVMAAGKEFTTNDAAMRQDVGKVYVMLAVPTDTPLTTPNVLTEAVPGALLLHAPPGLLLPSAVVRP